MTEVPVLISGAGPTGLFAALHLRKMNIPFRLIERDLTFSPLSKALGLHSRTQEILQMTDPALVQEFLENGRQANLFRIYFGGTFAGSIEQAPSKESYFSNVVLLPQFKTVSILSKALEKAGGEIDWGWELVDTKVVESSDETLSSSPSSSPSSPPTWVETTIRRALDGTNKRTGESKVLGTVDLVLEDEDKQYEYETIRSQFLIGADGGRSAVRHKINMPFPGTTRDINMILFEGTVESNVPLDEITFLNGNFNRTAGWFPLGGNRIQLIVETGFLTPEQFEAQKSETLVLEAYQQMLDETIHPHKITIKTVDLLTNYRINERRAKDFSYKGRIFLAGDSAHVHSPAGGQGLNTGLQDAYNLAWKIGLVVNGSAPNSLLDSYGEERPAIADEIIKLTAKTLDEELGSSSNMFKRAFKRVFVALAPLIMPFLADDSPPYSMLGLRYHENSLNTTHKTQITPSGPGAVGRRARDSVLIPLGNKDSTGTVRLHELMGHPGAFQILVFTADLWASSPESAVNLAKTMDHHLSAWRSKWPSMAENGKHDAIRHHQFVAHTLTTLLCPNAANPLVHMTLGEGKAFADQKGVLHKRYSVSTKAKKSVESGGALVVVRPDSYIAYRVQGTGESAWNDVDEFFGSILIQRSTAIEG
ncbi:hypothetical protein EMPS_09567 [Entomortierella parvispora]|uniref:FAD-binding domain-containing protein n=1 Tax=Entomortierella parvispora TaxID=205924 RepID=A0A9P3HIT3_9FUNG|nr:hypothetical protein EMPS_09567 [Entomortierella parvispora]